MKKIFTIILSLSLLLVLPSCMGSHDGTEAKAGNGQGREIVDHIHDDQNTSDVTTGDDQYSPDEKTDPVESQKPQDTDEPEAETKPDDKPIETIGKPDENDAVAVAQIVLDRYETTLTVGQVDMPWETLYPTNATDKSTTWKTSDSNVATVDKYGRVTAVGAGECVITDTSSSNPDVTATFKVTVNPKPDIDGPTYIDGIMIANKSYPLPDDYNPGIDPVAQDALDTMIAAAKKDGITLEMISGFRSYQRQAELYSNYLLREGRDAADRYSARPGYSEHQTGLAFDLNSLEYSFSDTIEGKWIAEHCAEYGFIVRYPEDKEDVTGYHYEPWHVRYLGVEIAKKVKDSGLSLEEYLGISSTYDE